MQLYTWAVIYNAYQSQKILFWINDDFLNLHHKGQNPTKSNFSEHFAVSTCLLCHVSLHIVIGQSFFLFFRRGERQVVPVTRKTKKYKCYQTRSMMDWWWLNHLGLYIHLFIANAQLSIEFHQTSHNSSFSKLTVQAHSMIVLRFLIHMFRYRLNIIQFHALCSALMNK